MRKIFIISALACLFAGCKPNVTITVPPSAGLANFSNYLSIGSTYTAGFSDNSLTVSGQIGSYPNMLFQQFQLIPGVNGGAKSYFIQPLLHSDHGYPSAKLILGYLYNPCALDSSLAPVNYPNFIEDPIDPQRYTWQNNTYNNGQINNIAVPGMRVCDMPVQGYGGLNPYALRFFNNAASGTATPFDELNYRVRNLHPSYFTMCLGLEDILGFATNGGKGDGTGNALPAILNIYNNYDIEPLSVFETLYDSAVRVATSTAANGALINIPDLTMFPYFNVIPSNGLVLTRQSQADSLNAFWTHNPPAKAFQIGNNQYMVQDHNNIVRQSVPGELILMTVPQSHTNCLVLDSMGSYNPIPNLYVLTTEELQEIRSMTDLFNAYIYKESLIYHLAYVDLNKYLTTVNTGVVYSGVNYNTTFVSGGAFSLDGISLTQRGYGLVANQVITTVDSYYHATIPLINVNNFNGVLFP
jgi:hypothetical protein